METTTNEIADRIRDYFTVRPEFNAGGGVCTTQVFTVNQWVMTTGLTVNERERGWSNPTEVDDDLVVMICPVVMAEQAIAAGVNVDGYVTDAGSLLAWLEVIKTVLQVEIANSAVDLSAESLRELNRFWTDRMLDRSVVAGVVVPESYFA